VLEVPVTVAVNCRLAEAVRAAAEGVSETATDGVNETSTDGASVTIAVANFAGSAALVAVTKTLCRLAIDAGAV